MDWVADNLLLLVPMSVVGGPRGLRLSVSLRRARARRRRHHRRGPEAVRASSVGYSVDEPVQRVAVSYAPRGGEGDMLREVVLSGDPDELGADSHRSLRASRIRYGERRTLRIETDIVYDSSTAQLIASTLATCALPRREVIYELDPARYATLEAGAVVTLTDDELHLVDHVAIVQAIAWSATTLSVTLVPPPSTSGVQLHGNGGQTWHRRSPPSTHRPTTLNDDSAVTSRERDSLVGLVVAMCSGTRAGTDGGSGNSNAGDATTREQGDRPGWLSWVVTSGAGTSAGTSCSCRSHRAR